MARFLQTFVLFMVLSLLLSSRSDGKTLNAVFTEWYPYTYMKQGQARGFSIEIYGEIFRRLGIKVKYWQIPWARAMLEFKDEKFDLILDSSERANGNCAKKPPIPWVINIWVHEKSNLTDFSSYSQLKNKDVAFVRGYTYPKGFNQYDAFRRKVSVTNDTMGLRILDAERVDAFIGDILNNSELAKHYNYKVRPLSPAVELQFLTLCFSKRLAKELKAFEASLLEMYTDGSIDKIYQKYFGLTYRELIDRYGS